MSLIQSVRMIGHDRYVYRKQMQRAIEIDHLLPRQRAYALSAQGVFPIRLPCTRHERPHWRLIWTERR